MKRASFVLQMKKVMTYLKLSAKSEPVLGQFGQCIVSTFLKSQEPEAFEVEVNCELAEQGLILEHCAADCQKSKHSILLRHPPFCPMLHLSPELKQKFQQSESSVSYTHQTLPTTPYV